MTEKLRINRADEAASKQSGLPALFYAIKRKFGDEIANLYLQSYRKVNAK